ncbi:hypothetical protein [Burkholderia contaminans]|uniref:hypothetical protein n=1 Tax=Burkholderia contaminans TaxID=488447 RepID=UPI0015888964|nr:hypothetical protein [Burkholderia contaminans]ELK6463796.1 hypothetical protein [Burkholderia contaminans]
MKRIYFFASREDILSIAEMLESKEPVKYILAHHNLHPKYGAVAPIYETARDIPDLGIAAGSQTGRCERYLVAERSISVTPMSRLIGGGTGEGKLITAYEAGNCAECVEFNAGGFWSDRVLINGLVQAWSDNPAAQKLMRKFESAFKKKFVTELASHWIGPEAYEFLKGGGRLTLNAEASPEFDIKLPPSDAGH